MIPYRTTTHDDENIGHRPKKEARIPYFSFLGCVCYYCVVVVVVVVVKKMSGPKRMNERMNE